MISNCIDLSANFMSMFFYNIIVLHYVEVLIFLSILQLRDIIVYFYVLGNIYAASLNIIEQMYLCDFTTSFLVYIPGVWESITGP